MPALLPPIPPGAVVVTIGDSIMRGWGLLDVQAWPALLSAGAPWHLVNLACDGAGFVTMGDGCDTNFMGLIPQAVAAKPTAVVIQSSSNDMGQSDAAIEEATQQTMAALRAALPHATVVALSTVWNADTTWPHEITSSSAAIERAASHQQAYYVDLGQPLAGHPEWMQPDGVHPTADGQQAIADAVQREIAPHVAP